MVIEVTKIRPLVVGILFLGEWKLLTSEKKGWEAHDFPRLIEWDLIIILGGDFGVLVPKNEHCTSFLNSQEPEMKGNKYMEMAMMDLKILHQTGV